MVTLADPKLDVSLEHIRLTAGFWHRQKIIGENWRNILYIDDEKREITLFAILFREDETYTGIVRRLWDVWNPDDE